MSSHIALPDINKKENFDLVEDVEGENTQQVESFDPKEARRIVNKVDWHVIPILTILYIMCFIDRSNSIP